MHSPPSKWKGFEATILDSYDATTLLNAPFKVFLLDSVKQILDSNGKVIEIVIPDPDGLVKAVAQSRVLHPHKLAGPDLKFLRSALGLKSKDLASRIAVTPEHMSRLEAGEKVLSPQSEMLVRIFTFVSTLPFTPKRMVDAEKVAEEVSKVFCSLSIVAVHSIDDDIELRFVRCAPSEAGDPEQDEKGLWDVPIDPIAA
jgi:transcriptional regulator with XRE-family HTH domain